MAEQDAAKQENWVDIKGLLEDVTAELKIGDLVHGPDFRLADAMCCLEVMHPKMDSGMSKEEKVTLDSLMSTGALVSDDQLQTNEIIGFSDHLLNCEMTYYQGQPAPQTLFTCLYLHRPLTLKSVVVRAIAVQALKRAQRVREQVQRADVFEEEDFVVQLFDFGLCEELLDSEAVRLVKEAEDVVVQQTATASEEEKPLLEALLVRIRFRKQLLLAQIYLEKINEKNFELARKCLTAAQAEFEKLKATISLAKIPESVFDERVTRHIMSSSPPRTTTIISQEKTLAFFDEQIKHLLFVCNFYKIEPTVPALNEFYLEFSYLVPDIVARSTMHAHFLSNKKVMGTVTQLDFAVDAMKKMGVPPHLFEKLDSKEMEATKRFSERVGTVLYVYFRVLLNNRSRLRRKIAHLLEDYAVLQNEADELDDQCRRAERATDHSRAFAEYILEQKLRLMILWLNLGFELDLYPKEEHCLIYWYLDYLQACNIQNHNNLIETNRRESTEIAKKAKNKKLMQQAIKNTQTLVAVFFVPHYFLASNLFLAKGTMKYLGALQQIGHVSSKAFPYGDPAVRFFKRFSVFHKVQYIPQLKTYDQFVDTFTRDIVQVPVEKTISDAINLFQQAKVYLEKVIHNQPAPSASIIADAKNLMRVAITNTLQCQMLLKNLNNDTPKQPATFNFSCHHYYPIVNIPK